MQKKIAFVRAKIRASSGFRFWPSLLFLAVVIVCLFLFFALLIVPQTIRGMGILLMQGDLKQILSDRDASVEKWLKEEGDDIHVGDDLLVIRDLDQKNRLITIRAHVDGVLAEIIAYSDTVVRKGQALALVTHGGDGRKDLELIGFVSSLEGKKINPGMKAKIFPTITNPYAHGHILARVKRIGKLPMTKAAVQSIVKIPEVAKYLRGKIEAEPFVVVLELIKNPEHKTGYQWSRAGPSFAFDSGILADIAIIYDEPSLLELLWPSVFAWFRRE